MSYRNVFYGTIGPLTFYSREGDIIDGTEMRKYLPEDFLIHGFTKLNLGYQLRYHIQVYNETSVSVTFYLSNSDFYGENIRRNLDECVSQVQTHIDYNNIVDDDECDDENELTIKWLGTKEEGKGKGLAKYLLLLSNKYCSIVSPDIMFSKLDDDSDGYANGIENLSDDEKTLKRNKNLYCGVGYTYEDLDGGPEMFGTVSEIASDINIGKFIDRYSPERVAQRTLTQNRSMGVELEEDVPLRRSKRKRGGGKKKKSKKKSRKKSKKKKNFRNK